MRISDWSSDVCSSDLNKCVHRRALGHVIASEQLPRCHRRLAGPLDECGADRAFATCDEQAVVDQFAGRAAGMFDVGGVHAEAFAVIFEEGSRYGIKGTDLTFNEIGVVREVDPRFGLVRSEEHTSELKSLMRI